MVLILDLNLNCVQTFSFPAFAVSGIIRTTYINHCRCRLTNFQKAAARKHVHHFSPDSDPNQEVVNHFRLRYCFKKYLTSIINYNLLRDAHFRHN